MLDNLLPAHLIKRIEDLQGREISYIEDELFSEEALTNLAYREELERLFKLDPLESVSDFISCYQIQYLKCTMSAKRTTDLFWLKRLII